MNLEKELINYFKSLGLEVNTTTKARGYQGFCLKNRIDISKNTPKNRKISTLLHEFAHYVHSKIEPEATRTGGNLQNLFGEDGVLLKEELIKVTNFVDENSKFEKLKIHKLKVKEKILALESIIKSEYPKFLRSKKFKEFDKYIKKSKAKYLLKYDRIKLYSWFMFKAEVYSINNLEKDFPQMPKAFAAYIRLKSMQKKQSRISKRINKLTKYYEKPTELFARFVEGFYLDKEMTKTLASKSYQTFLNQIGTEKYLELKTALKICEAL